MAERISYNCALAGVCATAVEYCFRFAPPLVITEAEIEDIIGRTDIAIRRTMDGFPKDVDFLETSSPSIGDRPAATE
jgi:adenosylmethionine-8-amino-7-oxononanoate aminotransferase